MNQNQLRNEYMRSIVMREVRTKRFEMLLKNECDNPNDPDLDLIDLQDYKFIVGEIVEIYHRKNDRV